MHTAIAIATAVNNAASSGQVVNAVWAICGELEPRIRQIGPACAMSGRCCRFEEYGHRLYVTTAELAAFTVMARRTPVPAELLHRQDGGGCRFQQDKRCMVHLLRPMGCRIFYCDPTTEGPLQELFEEMHQRIKRVHEEMGVPYYYLEWRTALTIIEPLLLPHATHPGDCPTA